MLWALGGRPVCPAPGPALMKLYLFSFLLFLLLVDQSLSANFRSRPSSTAKLRRAKWGKKLKHGKWENHMDNIEQKFPLQLHSNASLSQIKGLSLIKYYLSNYGYIESSGPFNDSLDQETISAINTYQQYFNLQITGNLNNETIQLLSLLRCGVPDINFDYNFTDNDNVSYPKAGHRWFPNTNLTYGFLPESQIPDNMTKVFRDAFARWAQATAVLNLMETTYDNADIKVGFYNFSYLGIEDEVLGGSLIFLQPDSNVTTGDILLDAAKFWALPSENDSVSWEKGVLDLESVAMHQIGHLLGIDHSNKEDSVMYPYILPSQQRKVQLSNSDKKNIMEQYSTNANSGCDCGRWGVVLLITTLLSLEFAYMVPLA